MPKAARVLRKQKRRKLLKYEILTCCDNAADELCCNEPVATIQGRHKYLPFVIFQEKYDSLVQPDKVLVNQYVDRDHVDRYQFVGWISLEVVAKKFTGTQISFASQHEVVENHICLQVMQEIQPRIHLQSSKKRRNPSNREEFA